MKYIFTLLRNRFPVILALLLAASLMIQPAPALAALGITSVSPTTITNDVAVTLTISGSEFAAGAIASLSGGVNLATTYVNTTTLTAVVSAGLAPGVYALTVTNLDTTSATLPNALTVFAVAPTAVEITPTPEPDTASFLRPVIVVQSYSASISPVKWGQEFDLVIRLYNAGQKMAMNVVATFLSSDVTPRTTGGVIAIAQLAPDNHTKITQPMTVNWDLWGKTAAAIELNLVYTDDAGNAYSEKFNLSVPLQPPVYTAPTPTATSTAIPPASRAQLVITSYTSDIAPLQPGAQFNLELVISNLGDGTAERVTMIVGGGSISMSTETPGGVSGSSGEFTNFAPLGASNIQSIGDLLMGDTLVARQPLVVNVSTAPGAYPLKISFTYLNENGQPVVDEQVITLLVYSLPRVEVSFYRDPNPVFAGQETMLPLQIVNLGRNFSVLGNMTVTASQGQVMNNTLLVGSLDPGGYFTLDASLVPDTAGPLELTISVDYTDDFNQPRQIVQTLTLDVQEQFFPEEPVEPIPGEGEGGFPETQPETFWQKVVRFFLGLLGMDSAQQQQSGGDIYYPVEEVPVEEPVYSQPLKGP